MRTAKRRALKPAPVQALGEVVVAGNVVTSQGPGTSLAFAVKLVELLYGNEKAQEIADQMLVPRA